MDTFVIVGFRYDTKHSIGYTTLSTPENVATAVKILLDSKKADVISIRRVYEKCPQSQQTT